MRRTGRSRERERLAHPGRAWSALVLGTLAQAAGTVFVFTPSFLIPALHTDRGLSLAEAGLLASAPALGVAAALVAWGALADRVGEKGVIVAGLVLTAAAALAGMLSSGYLALGAVLLVGGMAAASANAASGRVVVGWFPRSRRGLAMGIRQMGIPLGTTTAAVTVPAAAPSGVTAAFAIPLGVTAVVAAAGAIGIRNPPRSPDEAGHPDPGNPYRRSAFLVRIHAASALLVVPQITLAVFGLVWLVTEFGWDPVAGGALLGSAQFAGAAGRIAMGALSDRVRSRVRPLRWISFTAVGVLLLLAAVDQLRWAGPAAAVFVLASIVSVADNGLAYTSVAEAAGPRWVGRALGIQNTGQYLAGAAVGPVVGALIGLVGYPLAFTAVALAPVAAVPLIPPRRDEQDLL